MPAIVAAAAVIVDSRISMLGIRTISYLKGRHLSTDEKYDMITRLVQKGRKKDAQKLALGFFPRDYALDIGLRIADGKWKYKETYEEETTQTP